MWLLKSVGDAVLCLNFIFSFVKVGRSQLSGDLPLIECLLFVLLWRLNLNCRWGGGGCHQPHMGNADYTGMYFREAFALGSKGVPRPDD